MMVLVCILWNWFLLIIFGGLFTSIMKACIWIINVAFSVQISMDVFLIDETMWVLICGMIVWVFALSSISPIGSKIQRMRFGIRKLKDSENFHVGKINGGIQQKVRDVYGTDMKVNLWVISAIAPAVDSIASFDIILSEDLISGNDNDLTVTIAHGYAKIYSGAHAHDYMIIGANIVGTLIIQTLRACMACFEIVSKMWLLRLCAFVPFVLTYTIGFMNDVCAVISNYGAQQATFKADQWLVQLGYGKGMLEYLQRNKHISLASDIKWQSLRSKIPDISLRQGRIEKMLRIST